MAVDVVGEVELRELRRLARDHSREVHHLGEPDHTPSTQQRIEVTFRQTPPRRTHGPHARRAAALIFLALLACGLLLYARGASTNPPGFYIDESSIAYNAQTIAQTGRDEHGEAWPLFFRAFGDYKNPTYVYLLAAVFRLTGPSIAAARLLSAALGAAAALLLGLLALRMTRSTEAAAVAFPASDKASYIPGTSLLVDGGLTARRAG